MSEEKMPKTKEPKKKEEDGFDDFKQFLKKSKIQNEVLKKIIEKPKLD